jgi:tetratricopeptide (TPR) repeat protein
VVVGQANVQGGETWAHLAAAAVKRFPGDAELEGQLERALGYLATGQGQLEQALEHDRRSITLLEHAYGLKGWRIANALVDLGQDYYDLGRFEEALATYSRALAMFEGSVGPDHPTLAPTLANVGDIHCRLGDTKRCLEECERAWRLIDPASDEYRKDSMMVLYHLADALYRNGRLEPAIVRAEQALRARRALFGRRHPRVVSSLIQLARFRAESGDLARAEQDLTEAYEIAKAIDGPRGIEAAKVLEERGRLNLLERVKRNAETDLETALAIYREKGRQPPLSLSALWARLHSPK